MSPASPRAPVDTVVFDGLALSKSLRGQLAEEIHELTKAGHRPPCLAVVIQAAVTEMHLKSIDNMKIGKMKIV